MEIVQVAIEYLPSVVIIAGVIGSATAFLLRYFRDNRTDEVEMTVLLTNTASTLLENMQQNIDLLKAENNRLRTRLREAEATNKDLVERMQSTEQNVTVLQTQMLAMEAEHKTQMLAMEAEQKKEIATLENKLTSRIDRGSSPDWSLDDEEN